LLLPLADFSRRVCSALDLLPGWYDDWVIFEREGIRQRLLHALETLSRRLAAGRHAEAVEAAISAVGADPLRESANRVLVEAHFAEGNLVEARRAYDRYRGIVGRELGVEPGPELRRLLQLISRDGHEKCVCGRGSGRPSTSMPSFSL
jgi:DNA-binding SARP family transcriptional activator